MGIMDKLGLGGSGEEEPTDEDFDLDDEFDAEDEFEGDFEEEAEQETEDNSPQEWDSAYHFLDDALKAQGFAGVQEFMAKAMMMRVVNSAEYRDQIKHGAQSLKMVNDAVESIEGVGNGGHTDYGEMARQLSEANELIDEVEDMTNEEDQMVWEGMRLVEDVLDAYQSNDRAIGNVEAGTKKRDQSL